MLRAVKRRWHSPSGYKEVLVLAIPLVVTTSSGSLQSFIDRMFLSWFDSNALAATVPAFLVCFTLTSLFLGIASYVGVLVAQHYGARQYHQIGAVTWQGFYIVALSLLVVVPVFIFMESRFFAIGHDPAIQVMEVSYARIFILSIPVAIVSGALSGFFSGIGRTAVVMWSNLLITLVNIVLDFALIFGSWGMPEMGVAGAALASVIALVAGTLVQLWIFFAPEYRRRFKTHQNWLFNYSLFKRLMGFGLPVGIQFQLQSLAWTMFVLVIGKIGVIELTAHSIAMNVFIVAVMPMTGMSIAVSVLVGQRLGASNPDDAERVTLSALHLAVVFFAVAGLIAVIWPSWFISPFSKGMDPTMYREVIPLVQKLMKLVAVFCMFKSISLMIAGALKGAGDTHFVAWTEISSMWLLLVLPTVLLVYFVGGDLLWSWGFFVLSGITICLIHWLRFRTAKWKLIRMCKE